MGAIWQTVAGEATLRRRNKQSVSVAVAVELSIYQNVSCDCTVQKSGAQLKMDRRRVTSDSCTSDLLTRRYIDHLRGSLEDEDKTKNAKERI